MKKTSINLVAFLLFFATAFTVSCKKEDKKTDNGFSEEINSIISQQLMDSLRKKGMVIYNGKTPPIVNGVYLVNPYTLVSPYGPSDGWDVGHVISDYKYKMYDQTAGDVKIDYKQIGGSDEGNGVGSFISGTGNKFSIFSELAGTSGSVSYTHVAVISGEITADGIKDFQYGFILTKKTGDDNNTVLIPVGSSRIWDDGDNLADKAAEFKPVNMPSQNMPSMFSIK
ncbi:MAG TPA: hypothetical protein VL098_15185 [Flavipsychrobacter sp.]|nr:hypothetical protein [Flavipsychrobacter sp.]